MKLKQLLKEIKAKPASGPAKDGEVQHGFLDRLCEHCHEFKKLSYSQKHDAWICLSCHVESV